MKSIRPGVGAALLFLLALAALSTAAQPPAADETVAPPDSANELARIRAALERIADSLQRQNEGQKTELAMRRLDMESRAAERLEGEIASLVSSRDSLEDERFRMQGQLVAIARDAEEPDSAYTQQEVSRLREQFELQLGLLEARIAELDHRTGELRNQLAGHRDTARGWRSLIDRYLQNEFGPP